MASRCTICSERFGGFNEHPDVKAIYPIHMNPIVRKAADEELGDCKQIHIIDPIEVFDCHNFEARCFLCLTDSGGIQEECPSYGKPVLVMRDTTERPEGVDAGTLKLVGTSEEKYMSGLQNCSIMKKNMQRWHMLPIRMEMAMLVKELQTFWKRIYFYLMFAWK